MDIRADKVTDKNKWIAGIEWIQRVVREMGKTYPIVETGRKINEQQFVAIQEVFAQISKDTIKEYNENRGFLDLVHKEKGASLHRLDETGKPIVFNADEKQQKDELSSAMNRDILISMVAHLEKLYGAKQTAYCAGFLSLNKKTPENYVEYLNANQKGHHFARMAGLALKEIYATYPELNNPKYPVDKIESLPTYKFTSAPKIKEEEHVSLTT